VFRHADCRPRRSSMRSWVPATLVWRCCWLALVDRSALGPAATARLGCQLIAARCLLLFCWPGSRPGDVLKTVILVFGLACRIGTNSRFV